MSTWRTGVWRAGVWSASSWACGIPVFNPRSPRALTLADMRAVRARSGIPAQKAYSSPSRRAATYSPPSLPWSPGSP